MTHYDSLYSDRLADIRNHPELHQHSYDELCACCEVLPGVLDANLMDAHRGAVVQTNVRGKCDVTEGPCSCGSWHHINPITGERM